MVWGKDENERKNRKRRIRYNDRKYNRRHLIQWNKIEMKYFLVWESSKWSEEHPVFSSACFQAPRHQDGPEWSWQFGQDLYGGH